MAKRKTLLLSTFGGQVNEVVTGLRSLPHDHLVIISGKGDMERDEHNQLLSLLERLKVHHQVMMVDTLDLTGSAFSIERLVRQYKGRGWQVLVDITGGDKLLSDVTVLAAVATGSEVCCFESEARRIPLLEGMGVREMLPKEVVEALTDHVWPIPLAQVQDIFRQNARDGVFMKMKQMDLVSLRSINEMVHLCLTDRGQACLDWSRRMNDGVNGSSG